jgi:hypothetical protein
MSHFESHSGYHDDITSGQDTSEQDKDLVIEEDDLDVEDGGEEDVGSDREGMDSDKEDVLEEYAEDEDVSIRVMDNFSHILQVLDYTSKPVYSPFTWSYTANRFRP